MSQNKEEIPIKKTINEKDQSESFSIDLKTLEQKISKKEQQKESEEKEINTLPSEEKILELGEQYQLNFRLVYQTVQLTGTRVRQLILKLVTALLDLQEVSPLTSEVERYLKQKKIEKSDLKWLKDGFQYFRKSEEKLNM